MGGRGNAAEVLATVQEVIRRPQWERYFEGFEPSHHFHGSEDYRTWLEETGFRPQRVELIPKDMQHEGVEGFVGWLRTTWFPYLDRVPEEHREALVQQLVETYLAAHPVDEAGHTHVGMTRLEVEAVAV